MRAVDWFSETWGHNPVHIASSGSWLEAESGDDQ